MYVTQFILIYCRFLIIISSNQNGKSYCCLRSVLHLNQINFPTKKVDYLGHGEWVNGGMAVPWHALNLKRSHYDFKNQNRWLKCKRNINMLSN